jgi:AcrR family transcriptional regulator
MPAKMTIQSAIEPQQARSRNTQRAILKATEKLMGRKPFERISVAEIAKTANISVGNFYNRFPDKTTLLITLFDEYAEERATFLLDAFSLDRWSGQSLQERVNRLVDFLVAFFWSRRALIRSYVLYYRSNPDAAPPGTRNRLREISNAGAEVLIDACPAGKDSRESTRLGLQIVIALCREFILFGDDPSKTKLRLSRKKISRTLSHVLMTYIQQET